MLEQSECTSCYAKYMRAYGWESYHLERALAGEDADTELVKGEDGESLKIKTASSSCVATKWKTWEEALR